MLPSTIRHGDLVIDHRDDGAVQIVRQSNAQAIVLSPTEFDFVVEVRKFFGWPVAAPGDIAVRS